MVADFKTIDTPKSLVRVPGSGRGLSAIAISCDLGRVSSLAASVPINPNLPAIITSGSKRLSPVFSPTPNKLASKEDAVFGSSRKRLCDTQDEESVSSKRSREDASISSPPTQVKLNMRTGQLVVLSPIEGLTRERKELLRLATYAIRRLSSTNTGRTLQSVLTEQETLRRENQELKQRVAYFQQVQRENERRIARLGRPL